MLPPCIYAAENTADAGNSGLMPRAVETWASACTNSRAKTNDGASKAGRAKAPSDVSCNC
eukprot:1252082-Pyramimonas_sp.AAC.1